MSIDIYDLAPTYPDEARREKAVEASGALRTANDPVLLDIVAQARRAFDTPMSAISIVYRDWQYLVAADGLPGGPYTRRTSFCGHVIMATDGVLCVPDALADARFAHNPAVQDGPLVRFYTGAPLIDEEGFPLGALCVFDSRPRECLRSPEEARLKSLAVEAVARFGTLRRDAIAASLAAQGLAGAAAIGA